jgi:hypothetical protein
MLHLLAQIVKLFAGFDNVGAKPDEITACTKNVSSEI